MKNSKNLIFLFIFVFIFSGFVAFYYFFVFDKNKDIEENKKIISENIGSKVEKVEILENLEKIENSDNLDNSEKIKNIENKILEEKNISEKMEEDFLKKYPQDDDSIFKFVSPEISFENVAYKPSNLVNLRATKHLSLVKNEQIREDILPALTKMSEDFYSYFSKPLLVVSVYRSYDRQKQIATNNPKCVSDGFCSNAGHSEHQSGLAIDFFEATSENEFMSKANNVKYYDWLSKNAHYYGFTQSYRKGREIDGYNIEPWHWRYVGVELATELHKQKITLSEWYNKNFK